VSDAQALESYKKGLMEFGSFTTMFVIIATIALLNLRCMVFGSATALLYGGSTGLGALFLQAVLCVLVVTINFPVYEALFLRRDDGRLLSFVSLISLCIVLPLFILPTNM
jgi:hypothetical protein